MVSIDWSQIEPVITANIAGDVKAIEYYESGHKFYDAIVKYSGVPYKVAKTTLLAQLYGEGLKKLAGDLRITMEEAQKIVNLIWSVLPGCARLVDKPWRGGKLQSIAQQYKLIFTLAGRIAPIPAGWYPCWEGHETKEEIAACTKCKSNGRIYSVQTHKGVNYFVQGSAYDLLADAEVNIEKAGLGDAIYLPMHDELIVKADAAVDIQRIMEQPSDRLIMLSKRVPKLRTDRVHLGERWSAA
jgi:DNA polymerase-1